MAARYEKRMTRIERVLVKIAEDVNKGTSSNDTKGLGSEFFKSRRDNNEGSSAEVEVSNLLDKLSGKTPINKKTNQRMN
jgi:hypothetical protein